MPKTKALNMQLPISREDLDYILQYVTPERRVEVLRAEADRVSGAKWDQLTAALSDQDKSALLLGPMFVGGDSSDITMFVEDIWDKPVTPDNLRECIEAFKKWYEAVAPDEYHPPRPTFSLWGEEGFRDHTL